MNIEIIMITYIISAILTGHHVADSTAESVRD